MHGRWFSCLLCVLWAQSLCACEVLSWFESHPERTRAAYGVVVLKGHIDAPFTISTSWSYRTKADISKCRTGYSFATEHWSGIVKRFPGPTAVVDAEGNYRLELKLEPPKELPECQWWFQEVNVVARFREPSPHRDVVGMVFESEENRRPVADYICTYLATEDLMGCEPVDWEATGNFQRVDIGLPTMHGQVEERTFNIRTVPPSRVFPYNHDDTLPTGPRHDDGTMQHNP